MRSRKPKKTKPKKYRQSNRLHYPGTRYEKPVIQAACDLRKQGKTYGEICVALGIYPNKDTLRRWFRLSGIYEAQGEDTP